MKREDLTEKLLDIKREKGWSWKHICAEIGGYSDVLIVGAIMGQMKLTKPQAANAAELFGLSKSETAMLNEVPMRGSGRQSAKAPSRRSSAAESRTKNHFCSTVTLTILPVKALSRSL